jgi:hypothetical protein
VSFGRLPESPNSAFIRAHLESSEDYRESQRPDMSPWDMNKLLVGYHDVNDDGVQEMFLWLTCPLITAARLAAEEPAYRRPGPCGVPPSRLMLSWRPGCFTFNVRVGLQDLSPGPCGTISLR